MRMRMIGVAVVFLIGTVAGVAMSSGPNSVDAASTGLRVCINKKTGVIRSAAAGKCTKAEKASRLGIKGPRGLRGPKGAKGAAGADGVDGADGATGEAGPAGPAASWTYHPVVITYTGSLWGGCGDGAFSGNSGYVYTGNDFVMFAGSWNWASLPSCTISFNAVSP